MGHPGSRRRRTVEPLFELKLDLKPRGSREASRTLHHELRAAILDGRLAAGAKLPATRKSAAFFGVSRNTAAEVYERLVTEGHAVTRHGAGTYVAERTLAAASSRRSGEPGAVHRLNPFWLHADVAAAMEFWQDSSEANSPVRKGTLADFRPAMVDSRLFPLDVFRRVSAKQLRGLERKPASYKSPQGNQGNYHLRKAIIKHIAITRAVACQAEDILVTSGAQQAFDLLARALVTPDETTVALEDPGYPPMRVAFAAAGAKLAPVGIDEEGLIIEQLPPDVRVICVTPSHQFPLGVTMSLRRRQALIKFARERGAVIVEDDYDGEFRYEGSPLPALRTSEAADVVFYVGTFSKCMLSALRLGFIVAPGWAMRTLTAAKNCLDWHCPTPTQNAVAGFIAEGHLTRHVRKMRDIYGQRRQLLLELLQDKLSYWLRPIPSFYGMHIAALANPGVDLEAAAHDLLQQQVKIHTLSRYFLGRQSQAGLVFGYGTVDLPEIRRGLSMLRKALE
ncbi:MAG TPA: PLP-dependent aminotransferase family protein [Steroidobacteraceae bacterium]